MGVLGNTQVLQAGPRGARVEEVEATDEEPTGLTTFEIR